MKQQVRVGVLASLLMAPAVLASANEQVNQENMNPEEVVEQAAVVHPLAVNPVGVEITAAPVETTENEANTEDAIAQNQARAVMAAAPVVVEAPEAQVSSTFAANLTPGVVSDIDIKRINELIALGEDTIIYDYDKYRSWIEELGQDPNQISPDPKYRNILNNREVAFLTAKIDYLEEYYLINQKSKIINEELKLLKATNGNTITVVEDLKEKLENIENEYKTLRIKFLAAYNEFLNNPSSTDISATDSVQYLPNFLDTTEQFLKNNLSNYTNYEKFAQDILKPMQLIQDPLFNSGTGTVPLTYIIPVDKRDLYTDLFDFEDFSIYTGIPTYAEAVKEAYEKLTQFYTTEFTATEKQIFESHLYSEDTKNRTIKQILEQFKKDLDAADKVEKSINEIKDGINALTAAQFNSKMKSMLTAYEKLTDRQKAMVGSYDTVVDKWTTDTNNNPVDDKMDLLGAYEVSSAIAALKPSNKDEYREALFNADLSYKAMKVLDQTFAETYVKNHVLLAELNADIIKAVGNIQTTTSTPPTIVKVDGVIQYDYMDQNWQGDSVEGLIANLKKAPTAQGIINVRNAYNALTAAQKKLVNNYKELQDWEKFSKSSISLITQIEKIKIEDSKAFVSAVQKADKALEKLTDDQKKLVTNLERLKYLKDYADAVAKMNALKLSNKDEYREAVGNPNTTHIPAVEGTLAKKINELDDQLALTNDPSSPPSPLDELDDLYPDLLPKDRTDLQALKAILKKKIEDRQKEVANAKDVEQLIINANAKPANSSETEVDKLAAITVARTEYNKLSANEKKIVNNLKMLTDMEKVAGSPLKVMAAIDAVDPESSTFASKAKSAVSAYDKLTPTLKKYIDNVRTAKVEDFKTYLAFADQVKALKSTSPTFTNDLKKVVDLMQDLEDASKWKIYSVSTASTEEDLKVKAYASKLVAAALLLKPKIDAFQDAEVKAGDIDGMIDALARETNFEKFYEDAAKIDIAYAQLTPDGKKLVKKYKQFQDLKKDSTAAYNVIQQINNRTIYMTDVANSGYEKAIANALKAYEKLTPNQKRYVYNYSSVLEPQLRIYEVVGMINKLKPTSKTYLDDLTSVRLAYNALSKADQDKLAPIYYKITNGEVGMEEVREVINLINAAVPGEEDYVKKLQAARTAYDKLASLSPSYQKLVTNYKTLQDREKALKPVMTSVYQIQELQELIARPMNDAANFVSKYNAAVKAYEKVPYESRPLVHNRDVLLNTIYPVATAMEAILKIKANSNTFAADVRKAREWYDGLSPTDKGLITNYSDLLAFEQIVSGGSEVDALIAAIPSTPISGYMQAIKNARAAYNALLPDEKKAVTLYKELQNYEKGVKNVLAAIDAIDSIQNATNLVSAYDKAIKALDKLTSDERQMVPNMNKLQSVGPAIEVYKQIANLKPSQDNYAGAVQAVYAAYNRLSTIEKRYVTNFAQLQEAKNNVDNLAAVIAKITSITPGSRDYGRQVQEALALYNTLPAALKKMVPNIEMLNQSQKELTAAEKVRGMISEIDFNSANFVQKTLAARAAYDKLTTNEKRLVSNYFMLEDFEYQLGNMF